MTILVIDDETDIQTLFEQRFRREIRAHSLRFVFKNSAQTGLDFLAEYGSENTIIISDINMPGMSGLDLLRRIRATYLLPSPPVILMITAYHDAPTYQQAMQDGANDFLSKPIDFVQLRDKLSQQIRELTTLS